MSKANETPFDRSFYVKKAIREAAAELFVRDGYAATGIRDIAATAGTDPALVIRHFGSKEALFLATMTVGSTFGDIMAGPIDDLGVRLVQYLLSEAGTTAIRGVFVALTRASDRPEVKAQLQNSVQQAFITPIASRLDTADGELRAMLFGAQVAGLMSALWVHEDPRLARASTSSIVALYGGSLQQLLDAP
ncbi:TetR/AcrR family transcriptional regulator [Subtercola endophyticus]|uniref:TetR/AcrR family transcriptional regulator n=1 Tax=Subtercola endophyticus TaxID=2895559 RepID=UPI00272B5E10|nr:TetR family transcriptional regulator [Subtercola endophyticus]